VAGPGAQASSPPKVPAPCCILIIVFGWSEDPERCQLHCSENSQLPTFLHPGSAGVRDSVKPSYFARASKDKSSGELE
jgi:hypothetical protein